VPSEHIVYLTKRGLIIVNPKYSEYLGYFFARTLHKGVVWVEHLNQKQSLKTNAYSINKTLLCSMLNNRYCILKSKRISKPKCLNRKVE